MILFRFSKTDGAEFIAHLDILRHIGRTMRRAGIKVAFSQGFNPHMLIYLSAPMGIGIKSYAEYCIVDTDEEPNSFIEKFNEFSPMGFTCLGAWKTDKKVGVASDIVKAEYFVTGINDFDEKKILLRDEFIIEKKGEEKNVRHLIYSIEKKDNGISCVIGFANGIRIEKFVETLVKEFGGGEITAVKTRGLTEDGNDFENSLR
ncbi:MAG: DUF2344 domain-containing protein [Clostridiales bacterium]|nr:DUF2344 domain-containing protein [Clostridiales bacterium]